MHLIPLESVTYWSLFAITFLGAAIWESVRPWSRLSTPAERRWGNHGIILVACTVISVTLLRISPVVAAVLVAGNKFGVLNKAWAPFVVRCGIAILVLDFVKYAMHRAYHAVPWLWRVHQVHHSDPEFDVSTGLRVHPIEVILNQGSYLAAIAVLAPPPVAVLIAELLSCAESFIGHANASLPRWAEHPVRSVFITPTMHRVHHSEVAQEQFKNLGDIFPWWDRLLGTYLDAPAAGDDRIVTGLQGFQQESSLGVMFMLTQPFRKQPAAVAPEQEAALPTVLS